MLADLRIRWLKRQFLYAEDDERADILVEIHEIRGYYCDEDYNVAEKASKEVFIPLIACLIDEVCDEYEVDIESIPSILMAIYRMRGYRYVPEDFEDVIRQNFPVYLLRPFVEVLWRDNKENFDNLALHRPCFALEYFRFMNDCTLVGFNHLYIYSRGCK